MSPVLTTVALVLSQVAVPSPDQPWSIETRATLRVADGAIVEVTLPGGELDDVSVKVSHVPSLITGQAYALDLVQARGGLRVDGPAIPLDPTVTPPPWVLAGSAWGSEGAPVEVPFFVNVGSWPSSFDALELEQAFLDGLRSWNAQGGAPVFLDYGGLTTSTQYGSGSDGSNTTFFEDSTWGSTLAISVRTVVGDAIRDCDIRFYGANSNGTIDWNIDPNGAPDGGHAVRHTLVHELGHCLGISHSEVQDALMYAYAPADQGPGSWQLHPDDVGAVQAIYGVALPELVVNDWSVDGAQIGTVVSNVGDWAAFDVFAELQVDGVLHVLEIGDVWPGQPALLGVDRPEACGEVDAVLQLGDGLGATWSSTTTLDLPCEVFGGSAEEPGGCACSSTSGPHAWWLLGLLWMRRRR